MSASPQLLGSLKQAEGCKLVAYRDSEGYWSIGYGHKLNQSTDWTGYTITQQQADDWLEHDIENAQRQAATLSEWASLDTDCRRDALTECVFNLGIGNWTRDFPQTRSALRLQQWTAAAQNLMASPLWIKQVGLRRVSRLADQFQNGSY